MLAAADFLALGFEVPDNEPAVHPTSDGDSSFRIDRDGKHRAFMKTEPVQFDRIRRRAGKRCNERRDSDKRAKRGHEETSLPDRKSAWESKELEQLKGCTGKWLSHRQPSVDFGGALQASVAELEDNSLRSRENFPCP
jgi:hypothetical protein